MGCPCLLAVYDIWKGFAKTLNYIHSCFENPQRFLGLVWACAVEKVEKRLTQLCLTEVAFGHILLDFSSAEIISLMTG